VLHTSLISEAFVCDAGAQWRAHRVSHLSQRRAGTPLLSLHSLAWSLTRPGFVRQQVFTLVSLVRNYALVLIEDRPVIG